jgi:hypothetical protein
VWPGKTRSKTRLQPVDFRFFFLLKWRRFDFFLNWPGWPSDPVKTRNPGLGPGQPSDPVKTRNPGLGPGQPSDPVKTRNPGLGPGQPPAGYKNYGWDASFPQ